MNSTDQNTSSVIPSQLKGLFSPSFLPTYDRVAAIAFLKILLFCLGIVLFLVVLVDNLENFDEFSKYARIHDKSVGEMGLILFKHYAAYAPSLVCQFMIMALPVAAGVIVVTQASLNREFTIMRASGVSMQRAILPILALALLFGFVYSMTRNFYVPTLLRKSFVMNNQLRPADIVPLKVTPMRDGDYLYFVEMGHYDSDTGTAYNLRIEARKAEDFGAGSNRYIEYRARKATLSFLVDVDSPDDVHERKWVPEEGGTMTTMSPSKKPKAAAWTTPLPTLVTPAMLERQVLTELVMTWNDLFRLDDLEIRLEIQRRFAEPFSAFAVLMVALPLILWTINMGQAPSYIANAILGVVVCGMFYVVRMSFFSWGAADILPPLIAAQGANLLFVGLGSYLLYKVES